ncbi:hypothetical protein EVA_13500, partial [gut metagenome]
WWMTSENNSKNDADNDANLDDGSGCAKN